MTYLKSMALSGFRGFREQSSLELGAPDGRNVGSGLTILAGANNTGKSSIVEALAFLAHTDKDVSLSSGRRNTSSFAHTTLQYEFAPVGRVVLQTERPGSNRLHWIWSDVKQGHGPSHPPVFVVPSSRLPATVQVVESATNRYAFARGVSEQFRSAHNHNFASRLFQAHQAADKFSAIATRILGTPYHWALEQLETNNAALGVRFPSPAQAPHGLDAVGDGVSRVLLLADAIYDSQPGELLVIDEPEMSLHPAAQRRLAGLLAELAIDRQVVLSTHSPLFVDWSWIQSGARLGRTHLGEGSLALSMLSMSTGRALAAGHDSRTGGLIYGSEARESFFLEDGVVLVEGQDDAWSYRRLTQKLNLRFGDRIHGWGVGGATRMPEFAKAFSELGMRRVAGILDRGQESLAAKLKSEFQEFGFYVSPANDVRGKQNGPKGLLDSSGQIEPEFESAASRLLQEVDSYLFPLVE